MIEPRHRAHLALEAHRIVLRRRLVERRGLNGLDRDAALELRIVAVVDHAHRAFAEHAAHLVAAERLLLGRCAWVLRRRARLRSRDAQLFLIPHAAMIPRSPYCYGEHERRTVACG